MLKATTALFLASLAGCTTTHHQRAWRASWVVAGIKLEGKCGPKPQALEEARFAQAAWGEAAQAHVERCADAK